MPPPLTVLILTAGFGEGHNSAARSIAEALLQESKGECQATVVDLFEDAAPISGAFYKWCYRQMINHLPNLWAWLFELTKKGNFAAMWWDRFIGVRAAMAARLHQHHPQVVVFTYPTYSYVLTSLKSDPAVPQPQRVFLAVTDSITIHPIWLHGAVDRVYVTDEFSQSIAQQGLRCAADVEVSGFPVAPAFASFPPRSPRPSTHPLRVLYFATTAKSHVRPTLRGLLQNLPPHASLTVIMGKHDKRLRSEVEQIAQEYPLAKITLIAWTREVPQLLMAHDIVISKAGGATVHECFAAGVPVITNYIIPGQEEGNAELLERLGCGCRCLVPSETGLLLVAMMADGRLDAMSQAMAKHRRPNGALRIAGAILDPASRD